MFCSSYVLGYFDLLRCRLEAVRLPPSYWPYLVDVALPPVDIRLAPDRPVGVAPGSGVVISGGGGGVKFPD